MAEITVQQFAMDEAALAKIDSYCEETDRLLAEMKQRQARINNLHRDSGERLDRIDAALERLSTEK